MKNSDLGCLCEYMLEVRRPLRERGSSSWTNLSSKRSELSRMSFPGRGFGNKIFDEVQLIVGFWNWAIMFGVPQRIWRILCGYSARERRLRFEDTTLTAIVPGSKWSVLLRRIVIQKAMRTVFVLYPQVGVRVYVDDVKLHVSRQDKRLVQR